MKKLFMALFLGLIIQVGFAQIPDPGGGKHLFANTIITAALVGQADHFPAELGILDVKSKAESGPFLTAALENPDQPLKTVWNVLALVLATLLAATLFVLAFAPFVWDFKSSSKTKTLKARPGVRTNSFDAKALSIDKGRAAL